MGILYIRRTGHDDLERARPFTLDDEIRSLNDGWVTLVPRECMDDELRGMHDLLAGD
jgi:hypothetical protein